MTKDVPQWSDEAVAEAFRAELRERFGAHNKAYRANEAAELEEIFHKNPERRGEPGFDVRNSFAWEVYNAADIRIDRNSVTIVMPQGFAFRTDLLPLFDHTAMAWSRPIIGATIVDGEPRPTIEITLVATWTDEMDAKLREEGGADKRVEVDLYEDDVRWLLEFMADRRAGLRERLQLSLEVIP